MSFIAVGRDLCLPYMSLLTAVGKREAGAQCTEQQDPYRRMSNCLGGCQKEGNSILFIVFQIKDICGYHRRCGENSYLTYKSETTTWEK